MGRVVVADGNVHRPLNPRNDLRDHSPDGFAWGYGGSGPSQLALALCADVLGDDEKALDVYMDFKWKFVAKLNQGEAWNATIAELLEHIEEGEDVASTT